VGDEEWVLEEVIEFLLMQASTNTILLHFLGIVFANWSLRTLNANAKNPVAA
jgi:hypothetical protein